MIDLLVMRFIETGTFTRRLVAMTDDEAYRKLQLELAANPAKGRQSNGSIGHEG